MPFANLVPSEKNIIISLLSVFTVVFMTKLLTKAFQKAAELPQKEQDTIAAFIFEEMRNEQIWQESLARSKPQLKKLAKEALHEHQGKKTAALDFN